MNEEQEQENTPSPSAEQAADLAALRAQAVDASAIEQVAEQASAAPNTPSAAAIGLAGMALGILRPLAGMMSPALKDAPGELWEPVTEGVAVLLDHYGLADNEMLQGPWARFGFSVLPLAGYVVMQSAKEAAEEKKTPPQVQVQAVTVTEKKEAGQSVTFGEVVPA